jgi:glutathione-regulated potassium-efflux system ancillary protein KefG
MRFCGIDFLPPFLVQGTHSMRDAELSRAAAEYASVVSALRDDRLDLDGARESDRLSAGHVRTPAA